ncbi:hypothetical protein BpHYR1_025944 [Brachionus plicatilis]|uniref:Ig-like domain-containing protein n=1 Tax=Brachionus plicatilis TaxID=10195 RepID=A0A3M7SMM2_BRAPC|nr:hypothetical protein BpHYR1_025944 [Brachionus plicatilis]
MLLGLVYCIKKYNSLIRIKNHFVNTKYCYMISVLSYFGLAGNVTVSLNSDSRFKEGSRATLRCNITGITAEQMDHLKWIKNSKVLSDAKLSHNSFHFDKLSLELYSLNYSKDNGIYSCEITLTNGQILVSNKLDIKVDFGPQIKLTSDPNQFTIMQGDRNFIEIYDFKNFRKTIYLNIKKSLFNLHNGTYSCYLDKLLKKNFDLFIRFGPFLANKSSEIHNQLKYQLKYSNETFGTSVLKFENVSRNDMGGYSCLDEEYSNISKNFMLYLFIDRVNIWSIFKNFHKFNNTNDLNAYVCYITNFKIKLNKKLSKAGSINYSFEDSIKKKYFFFFFTLTFFPLHYLNKYRRLTQTLIDFFQVPSALKDENQTEVYELTQNSFAELDCVSVGYPIANIYWKFDSFNVDLNPSKVFNSSWNQTSILVLENLSKNDQGNYSCGFVSDDVEHKKYFRIIFQSKPKSPILVSAEEMEGGLIKLIWYIEDIGNCALVSAETFQISELILPNNCYWQQGLFVYRKVERILLFKLISKINEFLENNFLINPPMSRNDFIFLPNLKTDTQKK